MSCDNRQIVELFKQGMTAAEIALSLGYDVAAVEYVLTHDAEAIAELKKVALQVKPTFSLDEAYQAAQEVAFNKMRELMVSAESDKAQLQAAAYILDGAQGLKKPKVVQNTVVQINNFNEILAEVKRRKKEMDDKLIEITATKQLQSATT